MSGIYIHSTSAIHAILRSGVLLGSTKEMQKTGASAADLGLQDNQLHTLFVEWRVNNLAESVSRIGAAKGDIRGVLVFKDPQGVMGNYGGYPAVFGARVPLTNLALRGIVVAQEDMQARNMSWESLRGLVRPYVGSTFASDVEEISKIKDGTYISEFLLSASNSGAFF
ncbi:MAG: hypothetical protein V4578_00530 [Pseudomonadota bacterium]